MIQLDDEFEFCRDKYGWILHQWRDGKDKQGNPKKQKSITYWSNLRQVAEYIIDRRAGNCESMRELTELFRLASRNLSSKLGEIA